MNTFLQDLKFSFRMLVKSPLFTGIAILTLMLGIGLNAATFSAVRGLLLKPLSGTHQPERLIQLYREWPGIEYGSNSVPHYQDLRDRSDEVFENVASWYFSHISLNAEGRSERIMGMVASANLFQTYGVTPALGRGFLPGIEDKDPGAHAVTVLGYRFWQSRFGGNESIVGQTIDINGSPFEVVGVAPRDFLGPIQVADVPLYVPLMMQPHIEPGRNRLESRGNNNMNVVARLRDGVSVQQASDAVDALVLQLADEYPDSYENQLGTTIALQSEAGIHPSFASAQKGMSAVMMAVVGLLLLIACVNVANLFLARARERQREVGIRLSMGASRWRIVRQLLTESIVFSAIAGVASLGLAHFTLRALSSIRPPMDGPFTFDLGLDPTVLAFTAVVSLGAGVLFGVVPALRATRRDLSHITRASVSQKRSRVSRGLVVVQMALSLVLLISSGLFLRSLQNATKIDPGFSQPQNLVMASLHPGLQGYDEPGTLEFFRRLGEQLEAKPAIQSVGFTSSVPLNIGGSDRGVSIPGYEFAEGERNSLNYAVVTSGYIEAMGIPLLEGRTFQRGDTADSQPVIIINRNFADRFWPGESAIGKTVSTASKDRQVVGVVETGKYRSLGEEPTAFMFLPYADQFQFGMTLVARSSGNPDEGLRSIRAAVTNLDSDLPLFDVRTMEDHMGIALLPARIGGSALGLFGVLGLLLAAVGIYGVMAYSVSQRQRELGIRVAVGADRSKIVRLVLGEGLKLALIGGAIGLLGAFGAAKLVAGLLYNTNALDPVAFIGVPLLLFLVATAAVYVPARRAARTDPMKALRSE